MIPECNSRLFMSDPSAKPTNRQRLNDGYEKRDVQAAWIFGIVAFLLVSGLIVHFCFAGVLERMEKKPMPTDAWAGARPAVNATAELKGVPQLQIAPEVDLQAFRAREDAQLNSYEWIDRSAGVVRIPIERAMELVAQRGLPARSQTNQTEVGPSSYDLQQKRPLYSQPEIKEDK